MAERRGREVLLEVLADEGVHHIFGNPGTTELPLMDELAARPDFQYILALQENTAVGMADGYAQATGRPAFVNLHTSSGMGGGMGNLTNAAANRTPLVVTAGQQDQRHLVADPLLAGDLVAMARPVSKWQHEVRSLAELGVVTRRAFADAAKPPTGPVFVSIPMDVLDSSGEVDVPARSTVAGTPVADPSGLAECARLLTDVAPDDVALIVTEEVAASGALDEVRWLAEALGCPVHGAALYSALPFPTDHPLWQGPLAPAAAVAREVLSRYRRVFQLGGQAGFVYPYTPGPAIPPDVDLLHLSADAGLVGRTYPTRLGLVGDIRTSVAALVPLVAARVDQAAAAAALGRRSADAAASTESFETTATGRYDAVPMHPMAAVHALLQALPTGGVVVDEAITTGTYVRGLHRTSSPGSYYFCRGGGLGWGMPASLGVKLARPDRPVLCVVGDGAAMYAIQSLWTAAHSGIPVVFAVVNNRQYRILRDNLAGSGGQSARTGRFVAMDLDDPPVDYVSLAAGFGVSGALVEKATDVVDATAAAFESGRPWLMELPIQGG